MLWFKKADMEKLGVFLAFMAMSFSLSAQELNIMTFNIRFNTSSDDLDAWSHRKDKVASQILFHEVQLLGVQEALHDQMMDLKERLPKFNYVGVGRDDGKEKGEYSAIFYDTTRLQLLKSQTFWLSETPAVQVVKAGMQPLQEL